MAEWTRFEWDPDKAASNFTKHGISFDAAQSVFADPHVIYLQDREPDGEPRWQALGRIQNRVMVLNVAHTVVQRGLTEITRIISAREATPEERKRYVRAIRL